MGIDLGTDYIKMIDKGQKHPYCEKNIVAIRDDKYLIAYGENAYAMFEKTPVNVIAQCPMSNGVIADSEKMEAMLILMLRKYTGVTKSVPDIYMAVPSDITEVQRRAFYQVLSGGVGAKKISLIDKGIADAIGIGMPIDKPIGNMIVNIGAATTEISIIYEGNIILGKMLKIGGNSLDEEIVTMVRRKYNLHIGTRSANELKNELCGFYTNYGKVVEVFGISSILGLPAKETVSAQDVQQCVQERLDIIFREVRQLFDRTAPQIRKDLQENGIYLTGGVSKIQGLDLYLEQATGIPVHQIKDPQGSTLRGIVKIMNNRDYWDFTYSIKDKASMYRV